MDDLVEHLAKHDEADEVKKEECYEINGDILVVQDIVLYGEVQESPNGHQKEKAEYNGEFIIETFFLKGEFAKPFLEIHNESLMNIVIIKPFCIVTRNTKPLATPFHSMEPLRYFIYGYYFLQFLLSFFICFLLSLF